MHKIFLLALASVIISGCSRDEGGSAEQPVILHNWSRDAVSIQCPSGDCPEGVGAVIFIQHMGNHIRSQRCTATLIAEDRILTNSHCNKGMDPDEALFFVNINSETEYYSVDTALFDTGMPSATPAAGMSPDLAIYELEEPIHRLIPHPISRAIPADMSQLVTYVINEPGQKLFENFHLEREFCSTIDHQPHFKGGVLDRAIGLALYGCPVIEGNSGSPVFLSSDKSEIQAVINTTYHLRANANSGPPDTAPIFGMGNRVQCMAIDGELAPKDLCVQAKYDNALKSPSGAFPTSIERPF